MAKQGPGKGGKKKELKTHVVKSPSGNTHVASKTVQKARSGKEIFKQKPAYSGKETKAGVTTNDGTFHRVTGPVSRRAARKLMEKDKAIHKADSLKHSGMVKRFASAKYKGNK